MRQLLLLRHAKSAWDDASVPDRDRALSGRGRRAAALMRQAMHDLGLQPDLVLVSPAKRTLETLEVLEPWDDTPLVEPIESLYLADEEQLLTALKEVAETVRSVLLIGHNPGLHDLALTVAGRSGPNPPGTAMRALAKCYPTGSLVEFTIACSWQDLGAGAGQLVRFITPKLLEQAAR